MHLAAFTIILAIKYAIAVSPSRGSKLDRTINTSYETKILPVTIDIVCDVPKTSSSQAQASGAPLGTDYIAIINHWRSKMGLKDLIGDTSLEESAREVVLAGNGRLAHKGDPGTFGQVLAPGTEYDFEHVFVGGWLCEMPSLRGLGDSCVVQSEGWAHSGQTEHAKLLTSERFSRVGCANYANLWCCNLA